MQDEYELRRRRIFDLMRGQPSPSTTPGFSGGTLQDQLSRSQQQQPITPLINPARIGPAPIEDKDAPPVAGTPEYDTAMAGAYPVSASGPSGQPSQQPAPPRLTYGKGGFSGDESLVKLETLRKSALPDYGRAKGGGYGALAGIDANRGGTLGEKIGGGLTGLLIGAIKPNMAAALKRDYEIKDAEAQAKRDQSLAQEAAQTQGMIEAPLIQHERIAQQQQEAEAQTAYRNQQLEEQRQRAAEAEKGRNQRATARREEQRLEHERKVAKDKADEEYRRSQPPRGANGTRGTSTDTGRKFKSAQTEYDSLISEEANALKAKDAAYKAYSDLANAVNAQGKPTASKEDVAASLKAAEDANTYYRGFGDKKRAAQSKMQENYVEPTVNTDLMPKPTHGMSRVTFRKNNPAYKRKSDAEVDAVLRENNYEPLP